MGLALTFTINATDPNFNNIDFCESTGNVRDGSAACTSYMSSSRQGLLGQWDGAVSILPPVVYQDPIIPGVVTGNGELQTCDSITLIASPVSAQAAFGYGCLCNPANDSGLTAAASTVVVTPRCQNAPATYPSPPLQRQLCLYAFDQGLKDAGQNPVRTYSTQRCITVAVSTPSAPAFLLPYARSQSSTDSSIPANGTFATQVSLQPQLARVDLSAYPVTTC